jgi:precorrin-6B methylase 2
MNSRHAIRLLVFTAVVSLVGGAASAQEKPFEPVSGQPGKDVVWVPTPQALVDMMLDMAEVTPQDYLMDLGSGDGRTVISAAKRGLRARGIEYNPDMVALAQRNAKMEGVSDRATFVQADIFETDFSQAQVITLFLLPNLNLKLRPTILNMKPGTRIVSNSFTMDDWTPDRTEMVADDCVTWCTAHLWIVPAKVEGTWDVPGRGALTLYQTFQEVTGSLGSTQIAEGKLRGDEITFTAGGMQYSGRVDGNTIRGANWTASRK